MASSEQTSRDQPPKRDTLEPYRHALRQHGPSFEATLWASREKQVGRFRVMSEMVDFTGRRVLDAGCGMGDLAAYLTSIGVEYGAYVGLEGLEELVREASNRRLPEARFIHVDFANDGEAFVRAYAPEMPELVVFSGSLNTFEQDFAIEVLERAWHAAGEVLVFNFLSSRWPHADRSDNTPANRFDPLVLLQWAMTRTPAVAFRQEYFDGHDGTIALFRV